MINGFFFFFKGKKITKWQLELSSSMSVDDVFDIYTSMNLVSIFHLEHEKKSNKMLNFKYIYLYRYLPIYNSVLELLERKIGQNCCCSPIDKLSFRFI